MILHAESYPLDGDDHMALSVRGYTLREIFSDLKLRAKAEQYVFDRAAWLAALLGESHYVNLFIQLSTGEENERQPFRNVLHI
jgi:hypothetical protein